MFHLIHVTVNLDLISHPVSESWVVVYAQKKYGKLDGENMAGNVMFADKDVEFTWNGGYYADKCPGGPKNDGGE